MLSIKLFILTESFFDMFSNKKDSCKVSSCLFVFVKIMLYMLFFSKMLIICMGKNLKIKSYLSDSLNTSAALPITTM